MQSLSWQEQLAQAIRSPNDLLEYSGLNANSIGYSPHTIKQFPVRVPYSFANRIKKNDPNDPILRQVFPYIDEEKEENGFINDPLSELNVQPIHGLLQKYNHRVLSITTGACAVHCRYCFRRHYPYQESSSSKHWQASLEYIIKDPTIEEVILSGGDPLTLSDRRVQEICYSLSQIKHLKRIRFHTRLPIVLPARMTKTLLKIMTANDKSIICVIHSNHANELDNEVANTIKHMQDFGLLMLNQSVLLKGINDSVESLINLSERLVENNVIPYYLHLLDAVAGAAHYNVSIEHAQNILKEMQNRVSGYLVPKLVKEEVGASSKTLMTK